MANHSDLKKHVLLAASLAGILTVASTIALPTTSFAADEKVPCYGINKCKGTGDCGGKGSSCAGTNACKGQGWISLDKDTCLKIEGGSLTAPEA